MRQPKSRFLVAAAATLFVLAGTGTALAGGDGHAGHHHGEFGHHAKPPGIEHLMHMADLLELTETQREQVHAILQEKMSGTLGKVMREMREARGALEAAIHDLDANETQIVDASRVVAEKAEQLALEQHQMIVDLVGLLDEPQRARLDEIREEMRSEGPHKRHRLRMKQRQPGTEG